MHRSILCCLAFGAVLAGRQTQVLLADVKGAMRGTVIGQTATPPSQTPVVKFAHLHLYRPRRVTGSALAPSIFVDDREVAKVGNGRRISIRLSPGGHNIRSDDKSSLISLVVAAGQDYFIRVDEEVGFWKGHGKLTLMVSEQGSAEFKLQRPVEDDRRIARDLIEGDSIADENPDPALPAATPEVSSESATAIKVSISSTPFGADIEIDGSFVGNTPSSVDLSAGDHYVVIKKMGYETWERKLKVMNGDVKINADLEKQKNPQ